MRSMSLAMIYIWNGGVDRCPWCAARFTGLDAASRLFGRGNRSLGGLHISGLFFFSEAYGVEGGLLALRVWSKWQPGNKRHLVDSSSSLSTRELFISWHLVQTGV